MASLKEQEIAPEEPFNPALSGFTRLKASVGWTEDWERGETLGEGEQGIVKLGRSSTTGREVGGENTAAE
jgi:hypothetical protein